MRIGLVNLITKTADVQADASVMRTAGLRPGTDQDLNVVETGRRLVRRGNEVTIFVADAYRPQSTGDLGGVKMDYIPTRLPWMFPPSLAPLTPSLREEIHREHFDVVQSGEVFQPGTYLTWAATRDGGPDMFIWQELDIYMQGPMGWLQKQYYRTLGKAVTRGCRAVIPRSRSAARHLLEAGVPEERIAPVVHSGVDTDVYRPLNKEDSRARFNVEEGQNVLLSIGRMHENKGMDLMVKAMSFLRVGDPDCLLILKGTGPQEPALREMVRSSGLEDHVRIMTDRLEQADMAALYNAADMLLVASRTDLFPFTAIESISCGVPIATSFARGLKSDIVDEGAGAMLPPGPEEMAGELRSLLEDPVGLDRMGARAREVALRDFSFDVGAERLLDIYTRRDG
ncbi:MAG: glycosyltransferase family 4 protein [Methanomassiliicoccus sp.]|nr:glycosyltransferase family 4 protein [Methanomassiliicoccus sp.]